MVGSQTHPLTRSLTNLRTDLLTIVRAGIGAAGARGLLERALASECERFDDVRIVCAGKAAPAMAATAARLLGARVRAGLLVAPRRADPPGRFESIAGGHPVPNAGSEAAGRRAVALAQSLGIGETLLVLLSGGASALMAVPADGVSLEDKRRTTERLLSEGAEIRSLNTVRKHLSAIKGGWLAMRASGPSRTFAISDVVGDDLSVIASGPTVADASTFDEALDVLRRLGGVRSYPASVVTHLTSGTLGDVPETPKPGDSRLSSAVSRVIGGRGDAMDGAVREAETRGYHVVRVEDPVVGEARVAAQSHWDAIVARAMQVGRPACIVSSGETTVHVIGGGVGGRNQEFALALAAPLAVLGVQAAMVSVDTDGIDGPTDAAGALADSTTCDRAREAGLAAPETFLADNNAHVFFKAISDLVLTGPTDTNVGDLHVILLA